MTERDSSRDSKSEHQPWMTVPYCFRTFRGVNVTQFDSCGNLLLSSRSGTRFRMKLAFEHQLAVPTTRARDLRENRPGAKRNSGLLDHCTV